MNEEKEWKQPKIEHMKETKWKWIVAYPENLILGKNTDIGAYTYINAKFSIEIQDNVSIGGGCHIYSHNTINNKEGKILIKENASIGAHSVIFPGVIIQKGESILAGSIVYRKNGWRKIKRPIGMDKL